MPQGREDRIGLIALGGVLLAGALVRLGLMLAWRPGFMGWPDAKSYLDVANSGELFSNWLRPAGYPIFLWVLDVFDPSLGFVVAVNHVLGLATALLLYLAVVRAGGPRLLGVVPAAIVALNGDSAFLEHSPLSEPLFAFLVAVALYVATRLLDRASPLWAAGLGVALAATASVRVVGLALLPIAALWLLLGSYGTFRRRAATTALATVGAVAVLGTYLVLEHAQTGETGMSRAGVWHLYGRVAPFADCSKFTPPAGTEVLCEQTTRDERPTTDAYIFNWWFSPAVRAFDYPFAAPPERRELVGAFAWTVIVNQPLDYAGEVFGDFLRYFAPESLRGVSGGPSYADLASEVTLLHPGYGGEGLDSARAFYGWKRDDFAVNRPLLASLQDYESATRVQGPLMVLLLALALAGPLVARGRLRSAALLFTLVALTLMVAPVASLQFAARTAVPAFGALGAAAAAGGWACVLAWRAREPAPAHGAR